MKNFYDNANDTRGVLRIGSHDISWNDVACALLEAIPDLAGAGAKSDDDYVKLLLSRIKSETIDHSKFFKSVSITEYLDRSLVDRLWKYISSWFQRILNFHVGESCPIFVKKEEDMKKAFGIFWLSKCEIWLSRKALSSIPYTLITLAHEYVHYVLYSVLPRLEYDNCPMILSEGFAEYACRLLYRGTNFNIPHDLKKSWDENYELGRILVEHMVETEGFGVEGFVKGFLYNISPNNPLKFLDKLFRL